jgi:hypothetical protein
VCHSVVDVGGVAEPFLTQRLHTQRRVRKAAKDKKKLVRECLEMLRLKVLPRDTETHHGGRQPHAASVKFGLLFTDEI